MCTRSTHQYSLNFSVLHKVQQIELSMYMLIQHNSTQTHTKTGIGFKKMRGVGFCNYFLCNKKGWIHADPLCTLLKQFIAFQPLKKLQTVRLVLFCLCQGLHFTASHPSPHASCCHNFQSSACAPLSEHHW